MNSRRLKKISSVSIAALAASGAVACSDSRIVALEETTKKLKSEIADIRNLQAEQTAMLREYGSNMRSLTGRVEEVQHVSTGKTQQLEETISKLKSRVPPPAGVPEDLLNDDDEKIGANTGPAAEQYKQALQLIRTGEFNSALETLSAFITANPGTAFTDNALFWRGISYQHLGKLDQAVSSFSEVYQKYPAEDFVAPSLFYLADTLVKLGSKQDAVLTLQKLLDEHPTAAIASRARVMLSELEPPASRSNPHKRRR